MMWPLMLCLIALAFAIGLVCGANLLARMLLRSFDAPPKSDL